MSSSECILLGHVARFLRLSRKAEQCFIVYLPGRPVLSRCCYTLSNGFNVDDSRRLTLDSLPITNFHSMS